MIRFFCDICKFNLLSWKVEPNLMCECGLLVEHEEEVDQ